MILRRRRLWFVVLVGLLSIVLAGGAWVWGASPSGIWCKDAERIELGMSRQEVAAIFSKPPNDYRYLSARPYLFNHQVWDAIDGQIEIWYDDSGVIRVSPSCDGVISCQFERLRSKLNWW